jgi:predicted membrane channel-forming protein YqfA (hemolysin III family)
MAQAMLEIAAAVLIPLLAFVLNWKVRASKGYMFSAGADLALATAAFDLAAIVDHVNFETVVRLPFFRENFVMMFSLMFCIVLITWLTALLPLEYQVTDGYDRSSRRYTSSRYRAFFVMGWMLVGPLLAAPIFAFTYG